MIKEVNNELELDAMVKHQQNVLAAGDDFWNDLENTNHKVKTIYNVDISKLDSTYKRMIDSLPEVNVTPGSIVNGVVSRKSKREIVVDINYKDSIFIDNRSDDTLLENIEIGNPVEVLITDVIEKPYQILGSISDVVRLRTNTELHESCNTNTPYLAHVMEIIPAGFMLKMDVNGVPVKAFMPNILADVNRFSKPNEILGTDIMVLLESTNKEQDVWVVSRKRYLETMIPKEIDKLYDTEGYLKREEVYHGHVTDTTGFGVFVQFHGCLTGMIHKYNIHPDWQDKLDKIVPGMSIDFYVKDVLKGKKIILTQVLRESLWDTIEDGMVMDGKVKAVKDFGVLVELDPETMGLLKNGYLVKNNIVLKNGEDVRVRIVNVDSNERKIFLVLARQQSEKKQ